MNIPWELYSLAKKFWVSARGFYSIEYPTIMIYQPHRMGEVLLQHLWNKINLSPKSMYFIDSKIIGPKTLI